MSETVRSDGRKQEYPDGEQIVPGVSEDARRFALEHRTEMRMLVSLQWLERRIGEEQEKLTAVNSVIEELEQQIQELPNKLLSKLAPICAQIQRSHSQMLDAALSIARFDLWIKQFEECIRKKKAQNRKPIREQYLSFLKREMGELETQRSEREMELDELAEQRKKVLKESVLQIAFNQARREEIERQIESARRKRWSLEAVIEGFQEKMEELKRELSPATLTFFEQLKEATGLQNPIAPAVHIEGPCSDFKLWYKCGACGTDLSPEQVSIVNKDGSAEMVECALCGRFLCY